MTVPVPSQLVYSDSGDGVTTTFSFPVRFLDKAEVVVLLRDVATGVDTKQVLGSDYTIAGSSWPTGGNIVFNTAPPVGTEVIRYRETVAKQVVDLANTQRNDAEAVETQLDRLAMVQQDQKQELARALKADFGEDGLTVERVAEGHFWKAGADGRMVDGGSAEDIINAQGYAAEAKEAQAAAIAAVNAGFIFDAVADAQSANIPPILDFIRTAGYATAGDGGGALYKRVETEPPHAGKIQSADGAWWELRDVLVNPVMFGALRGRANATATTAAINAMFAFCGLTGATFDLLGGSWFVNDTLEILTPVKGGGRGIGYWHTYAPAFNNGKSQVAQTQIVLTGTGPKNYHPHGMSSMRVSGGVVANPSARAGWNEAEYSLTNLNRDISIGLFIAPEAWGSSLSGFRVIPDGGGDDGMDLYNDETADASSGWAADWDVGIWADATRKLVVRDVQAVGHFRVAGKISAAIPMDTTLSPPPAPYEQFWENCDFGGYRSVLVRGADTFRITGIGADYVEIDYADDHPFDETVTTNFALSKNNFSHTPATFTGRSVIGGTLRLTGVSPNPDTSFDVGDSIVARLFGGGTSQIVHSNCRIHGMIHPSGKQCHDLDLGADAMPNPGTAVEISGHRLTEVVFDNRCSIQSGEQVAYHIHEASECQLTDVVEFNTDIDGSTRGMRIITSPLIGENTRVTNPCGATVRPCFGDGSITNLLNNNGPSGCLDLRPAIDIPSDAFALFTSDGGFMQAASLRIPALAMQMDMNNSVGLRTPKGGISGIFGDTYPAALAKFIYDAVADTLVNYEHIVPDIDATRDIGSAAKRVRHGYFRNATSISLSGQLVTIEDDATSGDISTPRKAGLFVLTHNADQNFPNADFSTVIFYDAGNSPTSAKIGTGIGTNVDLVTTDVTGTTGADGNVTISVQANVIKIENRSGASVTFSYQFLG